MIKIETETDPKKILRDKNIQLDIIRYGMKAGIKGTKGFKGRIRWEMKGWIK